MKHARLTQRGESFEVVDEGLRFVGECVWAWEDVPGAMPRRVYPITLLLQTIRQVDGERLRPLKAGRRAEIAREVKALLELRPDGCQVLLHD